jgi:hypothetical protein
LTIDAARTPMTIPPPLPPFDPAQAETWMWEALALAREAAEAVWCRWLRDLRRRGPAHRVGADRRQSEANRWLTPNGSPSKPPVRSKEIGDRRDGVVVTLEPARCAGRDPDGRVGRVIYGAPAEMGRGRISCRWLGSGKFPTRPS